MTTKTTKRIAKAYVDGSFNKKNGWYGSGVVFISDEGVIERISNGGNNTLGSSLWQVSGEILAARIAIQKAIDEHYDVVEIFYDYAGIECWASGAWRTKNPVTKSYKDFVWNASKIIEIGFFKVPAHSGVEFNEQADILAKQGCGILDGDVSSISGNGDSEETIEAGTHFSVDEKYTDLEAVKERDDINASCKRSILAFYKIKNPKFADYLNIKSFGRDFFSSKKIEYFRDSISKEALKYFETHATSDKDLLTMVRWYARGLSLYDARRKCEVDNEVTENAVKSKHSSRSYFST